MNQVPQLPYELISKICFEMRGMEHPIAAAIKELKCELYELEQIIWDEIVDIPVDYQDDEFVQLVEEAASETRCVMARCLPSLDVKLIRGGFSFSDDRDICDHLFHLKSQ